MESSGHFKLELGGQYHWNLHIIGLVEKDGEGNIDYQKLLVPIHDDSKNVKIWCLAIPFLHMGDYPTILNCANPYTEGVTALYKDAFEYASLKKQDGQTIIAMGHLHTHQAEVSDLDKTERPIMGGVECIPATAFHQDIKYVALGHICHPSGLIALHILKPLASCGYSAAKVATIPTQSTPPIPLQRSPRFRWKGRHLFRSKVRHFTPDLILLTD